MSQQLEIEFKSLLTHDQFIALKKYYQPILTTEQQQTNLYFDTLNNELKKHNCGLRIRLFSECAEVTLKQPEQQAHCLLETTEQISLNQANKMIKQKQLEHLPLIEKALQQWHIAIKELSIIGQLTTERTEGHLTKDRLLVLDKSHYYGQTDYEIEMEVVDPVDQLFFQQFLAKHHIPYQPALPKAQRMNQAKQQIMTNPYKNQ